MFFLIAHLQLVRLVMRTLLVPADSRTMVPVTEREGGFS